MSEWVASLPVHRSVIMGLIMFIYLLGGSFVDDLAFMLLATPIFFPIVLKLGYDPYWAGIMIAGFTIAIGSVVPPVAICVFVVKNVTKEPMGYLSWLFSLYDSIIFLHPPIVHISRTRNMASNCISEVMLEIP